MAFIRRTTDGILRGFDGLVTRNELCCCGFVVETCDDFDECMGFIDDDPPETSRDFMATIAPPAEIGCPECEEIGGSYVLPINTFAGQFFECCKFESIVDFDPGTADECWTGNVQARVIYCPSDEESAEVRVSFGGSGLGGAIYKLTGADAMDAIEDLCLNGFVVLPITSDELGLDTTFCDWPPTCILGFF